MSTFIRVSISKDGPSSLTATVVDADCKKVKGSSASLLHQDTDSAVLTLEVEEGQMIVLKCGQEEFSLPSKLPSQEEVAATRTQNLAPDVEADRQARLAEMKKAGSDTDPHSSTSGGVTSSAAKESERFANQDAMKDDIGSEKGKSTPASPAPAKKK